MPALELPGLYVDAVVAAAAGAPLLLLNRDPGPGETGVPLDWTIALEVLDTGPDGVDRAATRVWVDGALAFAGGGVPEHQPGFDGPRAQVLETPDTFRVVLDPTVPYRSQASVLIRVVSATIGGGQAIDQSYTFLVEDRTAPRVLAAQATSPTKVQIGFDEEVVVVDLHGVTFAPRDLPAVPVNAVSASAQGSVVTIELDTEMTPDVTYEVAALGAADRHGNPVLEPFHRAFFAGFRPARPPGRHFDLWSMLPRHNRRGDDTGDLRRFVACLREVVDLLLAEADRFVDVFDLERAPEPFLDLILQDLGDPFPFDLGVLAKRRLASVLVEMYRQKGTAVGIENAIRFFLGIDVTAVIPFTGTTLILGESELGVDWELGPSNRFALYAFDIVVDVPLTPVERRQIRAIVDYLKPAHTHFVDLIEPSAPVVYDHWELGISELGETTDLH